VEQSITGGIPKIFLIENLRWQANSAIMKYQASQLYLGWDLLQAGKAGF
jgi:hypothetical protein